MSDKLRIISLGAGVQSTAMLLMAQEGMWGDIPQYAIFSDTGAEPKPVYDWLEKLKGLSKIPIITVTNGNLEDDLLGWLKGTIKGGSQIPGYSMLNGEKGILPRQCTTDYKVAPIKRGGRKLMKEIGVKESEQWIGISWDEVQRMKPSRVKYSVHRWPLIERHITRDGCIKWLAERNIPEPPKSACYFCPFHNDRRWRDMQTGDKESFDRAVQFDTVYRHQPKLLADAYLHKSCKPLSEVDFRTDTELGQTDMFINECEGMCGV